MRGPSLLAEAPSIPRKANINSGGTSILPRGAPERATATAGTQQIYHSIWFCTAVTSSWCEERIINRSLHELPGWQEVVTEKKQQPFERVSNLGGVVPKCRVVSVTTTWGRVLGGDPVEVDSSSVDQTATQALTVPWHAGASTSTRTGTERTG